MTEDLVLEVNARGGIPLSLAGYLLRAIGAAYPHTSIQTGAAGRGPTLELLIASEDLYAAEDVSDDDLAALSSEKDIADLTAFTRGWRDGALGISPPQWLSELLQLAAEQMADALPPTAENYVAIDITRPGKDPFVWIVCRPGRPSPHQLRKEAEDQRDNANALLHRIAVATRGEAACCAANLEALPAEIERLRSELDAALARLGEGEA